MMNMWPVCVLSVLLFLQESDSASLLMPSVVKSPLHVAQCRATCLLQMWSGGEKKEGCTVDPQCSTCWKSCEELELATTTPTPSPLPTSTIQRSKSLATICSTSQCNSSPGCQGACSFYSRRLLITQSLPVVATNMQNVLQISSSSLVSWPKDSSLATNKLTTHPTPLVYVVIQQLPEMKWLQVAQTTESFAQLPPSVAGTASIRVLVVSPQGLESIYQLQKDAPTTTTPNPLEEIQKSWGKMMKVGEEEKEEEEKVGKESEVKVHEQEEEVTAESEVDPWDLKRLSLIHQKSLVIAELSWEPVKVMEEQEYLITWELDGGGLKGHLVTDSTTVSLSLWPDTLYHIQVELFQRSFEEGVQEEDTEQSPALILGSQSHSLIVDTSEASFPLLERPSALSSSRLLSVPTLLGMFVGVVLVLSCLLLALSIRRLLSLRPCSLLEKQLLQDTDEECCQDKKSSAAPSYSSSSSSPLPTSQGVVAVISSGALANNGSWKTHPHLDAEQVKCCSEKSPCWWLNNSPQRAPSP